MSCSITTREAEGVVIFDIVGRLSLPEPNIAPKFHALIKDGRRRFVINLSGVSYLDSYGIYDLITAFNAAKAVGGKIILLSPVPNVRKTVLITMKTTFTILDDESAAIAAANE